jgi:hypothetical protein
MSRGPEWELDNRDGSGAERKAYSSPSLVERGNVKEITRGSGTALTDVVVGMLQVPSVTG